MKNTCFQTSVAVIQSVYDWFNDDHGGWESFKKEYPVAHRAWTKQRWESDGSTDDEICVVMSQILNEDQS